MKQAKNPMSEEVEEGDFTCGDERVISARDLSLGYGDRPLLWDVNFQVKAGEFWFLLGPNGSGKTTLLRAILGLLKPLAGGIELHGPFADRANLGFVPQRCDLNPLMPTTVDEFVALGQVGIHRPRVERRRLVRQALEDVGLGDKINRSYWELSGGQKQRALLARALARQPRWLIFDEPTSGLDPATAQSLLGLLQTMNRRRGITLLFVAHDLTLALRYATHVALFHGGVVLAGPVGRVMTDEHLKAAYGIPIHVRDGAVQIALNAGDSGGARP